MAITATTGGTINNAVAGSSLAFAANTLTLGQWLVVAVAISNIAVSVSGISDGSANVYSFQSGVNNSTVRTELWTCPITAATASRTITVTLSGSSLASAAYEEYAGATAFGNLGSVTSGTSTYPENDVAMTDTSSWGIAALATANTSGDTYAANLGTIRQQIHPALTTVGVAIVDNTSVITTTLRNSVLSSASRNWAGASVELRTGLAATVAGSPKDTVLTPPSAAGSKHQIVKAPADVGFSPSHFTPVPVAAALKGGINGTAYSETISAQGGTPAYTFAVTSGALPTGTSLAPTTGIISGTPTVTATFTFTITVTDSLLFTGSQSFTIIIAPVASSGGGSYTFVG